jgi:hypothetical protein
MLGRVNFDFLLVQTRVAAVCNRTIGIDKHNRRSLFSTRGAAKKVVTDFAGVGVVLPVPKVMVPNNNIGLRAVLATSSSFHWFVPTLFHPGPPFLDFRLAIFFLRATFFGFGPNVKIESLSVNCARRILNMRDAPWPDARAGRLPSEKQA